MRCGESDMNRARRPAHAGLVALVLLVGAAAPAAASSFSIDRTRVYLSRTHASELVTLTNDSSETIRLQVSVHRWTQVPEEPIRLEPSEDIIFFPALMTLEPGQARPIRVGLSRAPDDQERAYRLVIEELPPPPRSDVTTLTVLTRLSVPVFVQPQKPEARLAVEGLARSSGGIAVTIANRGTAHVMVEQVALNGRDRDARPAGTAEATGWYVLAGSTQTFQVPMEAPCPAASTFEVALKTGEAVSRHTLPAASVCQP